MKFNATDGEPSLNISLDPEISDAGPTAQPSGQRRRDRHGRGLRGPLLPAALPGSRTRSEKFEDLVVDSAERLRTLWPEALGGVDYLVEEVPDQLEARIASGKPAPFGKFTRAVPATPDAPAEPALIAIYRHPVEVLCDTDGQLRELVHEAVVEQVAGLLNLDPEMVDPLFRRFRGH
ncbi:metallopeptidase family protein [Arthrobacter sp. LAPM80]|uniref:metallopeptidase family protein n=1 Tax=Arthrobacter sp. LAPM80 TaxID=3141788 RepID=UPI00398B2EA5